METFLKEYSDSQGNKIICPVSCENVRVTFLGKGNTLIVSKETFFLKGNIQFTGSNATVEFGKNSKNKPHIVNIRIGEDSLIHFGNGLTIEKNASFFACEGAQILIGDDCMIASNVQFRADDSHPIFDVATGNRVNYSKNIVIGNHCWIGYGCSILKGTHLKDGCVVGMNSIVTSSVPNNVLIAGVPAKVVKTNIAWERPNLATTQPPYKNHIDSIKKSDKYWNLTTDENRIPASLVESDPERAVELLSSISRKNYTVYYDCGMAYFKLKKYAMAAQNFILSLNACSREEDKFKIYKCIGNSFFRAKNYLNAIKYFNFARTMNPFDLGSIISSLIVNLKLERFDDAHQVVAEASEILSKDQFLKFLAQVYDYVNTAKDGRLKFSLSTIFYGIEFKDSNCPPDQKVVNDECYIFVQPLLDKPYLFSWKHFNCSTIYIKQNYSYLYFIPLFEKTLDRVSSMIESTTIRKVKILSTSAGAFFSILLGSHLAKRFPKLEFHVEAFAPQLVVLENENIRNVTHYKDFNVFVSNSSSFKIHDACFTNVISYLNNPGDNIKYHIYVGEKAEVDVVELSKVNCNSKIEKTVIPGFPFHSVLPLYRYDEKRLQKMYDSFAPLTPSSGKVPKIEYTIEDCLRLKKTQQYNLKNILPYMID